MTSTLLLTKTLRDGRIVNVTRARRFADLVATTPDGAVIVSGGLTAIKGPVPYAIVSVDRKAALGLTESERKTLVAAIAKADKAEADAAYAALPEAEKIRIEIDRIEAEIDRNQDHNYHRVIALRREADALRAKLAALS